MLTSANPCCSQRDDAAQQDAKHLVSRQFATPAQHVHNRYLCLHTLGLHKPFIYRLLSRGSLPAPRSLAAAAASFLFVSASLRRMPEAWQVCDVAPQGTPQGCYDCNPEYPKLRSPISQSAAGTSAPTGGRWVKVHNRRLNVASLLRMVKAWVRDLQCTCTAQPWQTKR